MKPSNDTATAGKDLHFLQSSLRQIASLFSPDTSFSFSAAKIPARDCGLYLAVSLTSESQLKTAPCVSLLKKRTFNSSPKSSAVVFDPSRSLIEPVV